MPPQPRVVDTRQRWAEGRYKLRAGNMVDIRASLAWVQRLRRQRRHEDWMGRVPLRSLDVGRYDVAADVRQSDDVSFVRKA